MTSYLQFQRVNDIEAMSFQIDAVAEYDESIETASDDQLRNWIIANGYTNEELDDHIACGFNIRELAENLQIQGHTFP